MSNIFPFRSTLIALLVLNCLDSVTLSQETLPKSPLPLKAALLLTPEFCTSRIAHGGQDNPKIGIEVGKVACTEFDPTLKEDFAALTTISDPKDAGDAQLILIPRFVDVAATTGLTAFSNNQLTLFLEWTVKSSSGQTIWLGTVQGSATHKAGTLFSYKKNFRLLVNETVKDVAFQSAQEISSAPELRKYTP